MTLTRFVTLAGCVLLAAGATAPAAEMPFISHAIELHERVLQPEEGLLLGNGDLSVSVYQDADRIIWRFGKGDVWDRRLDLSSDPKPARIDEIAHGIKEEGWKCPPYGGGPAVATRGTTNEQRMKELCQGAPPSYVKRPYPCPKPVGELALHLPSDQMGLRITQRLAIEEARLEITCAWASGARLNIECFVPPAPNVLVVRWNIENWNDSTRTGHDLPPVRFSLYRWADPPIEEFAERFAGEFLHEAFKAMCDPKVTPLPPPEVKGAEGLRWVEQRFPPDPLFKDGFRCLMAPFASGCAIARSDAARREARLRIMPPVAATHGLLFVAVATSRDPRGPEAELERVRSLVSPGPEAAGNGLAEANRRSAEGFWAKSRLRLSDALLENLWYETLHAQRCAYRHDTIPPGLFLPSTVQDYSHWHGDYHLNYNLQEPFWGDYTANHLDLGDGYFRALDFMLPIGRKIARDYYGGRGVFIQLTGYPIAAEDDPLGVVPMGRMAYMTGWAANQYWWHFRYTLDTNWLAQTGYPVLRDCALFYTDFMKQGPDGLYHVFPSNQGEDGFSGDPKDYTDRPQIMQHLRYCLRAALRAAETLDTDTELRAQWCERLDHCAGDDGRTLAVLSGLERLCHELSPPEFGEGRPYTPPPEKYDPAPAIGDTSWYFGQSSWGAMQTLRGGRFIAERDLPAFRRLVERWRHPNGVLWGMAIANYGRAGAWSEPLGVIAPLQEMLLQSWDGALRIFPAWPRETEARFENLRAEGAFLVSASWNQGRVQSLDILSERGAPCHLYPPWPEGMKVVDESGRTVECAPDEYGRPGFATRAGGRYHLSP